MTAIFETVWRFISGFFASYNWISDTLDIILVALGIYFVIRLVRDSRAEQFIRGIVVVLLLYGVSRLLDLTTARYLLESVFANSLVLIIIVFQPEVRRALEQAGRARTGFARVFGIGSLDNAAQIDQWNKAIKATAGAVEILQKEKMGALIVLERNTRLGEIVRSGTLLEAEPSASLISAVFYNKAPLHDGAMIKVYAAACILPLSENLQISRELGTRHRAGVGMSENSDAVVVILSEETGMISVAEGGELKRNFTPETLEKTLADRILWNQQETNVKSKRVRKQKKQKNEEEETV